MKHECILLLILLVVVASTLTACTEKYPRNKMKPSVKVDTDGYVGNPETVFANRGDYCIIKMTVDSAEYDYVIDDILYSDDNTTVTVVIKDENSSYKWNNGKQYYWTFMVPLRYKVEKINLEKR